MVQSILFGYFIISSWINSRFLRIFSNAWIQIKTSRGTNIHCPLRQMRILKKNPRQFLRGSIEIRHSWIDEVQTNLAVGILSSRFIKKNVFIFTLILSVKIKCELERDWRKNYELIQSLSFLGLCNDKKGKYPFEEEFPKAHRTHTESLLIHHTIPLI